MKTDKTIKGWIEKLDEIDEELCDLNGIEIEIITNNCKDVLKSLKNEMQEVLDTNYFKPIISIEDNGNEDNTL